MYFFSGVLGDVLGLQEGDPVELHQGLIRMIRNTFKILKTEAACTQHHVLPAIQMNTGDFYFNDPDMVRSVMNEYEKTRTEPDGYILPCIHQFGSAIPLPDNTEFFSHFLKNIQYHRTWGARNLTVHLPIRPNDDTEKVISVLTSSKFIETMLQPPKDPNYQFISIDLENNHHNSFFGNLDHVSAFIEKLDQRYQQLGIPHLSESINLCFDYGHYISQATKMNYEKREMLRRFFDKMRHRIKTLHLHMNDGSDDQHILVGLMPDAQNKIGTIPILGDLYREHTQILLETLPRLELHRERNWLLVAETDKPYTKEALANSFKLFAERM